MLRGVAVLLGLRFLLEVSLLVSWAVIGAAVTDRPLVGVAVAVALVLGVAAVWGLLLSPRRRVDLSLPWRVFLELALFVAAGVGLAASGHLGAGVALVAAEVVILTLLAVQGLPPGSDPQRPD
jgi:hypothetical protein